MGAIDALKEAFGSNDIRDRVTSNSKFRTFRLNRLSAGLLALLVAFAALSPQGLALVDSISDAIFKSHRSVPLLSYPYEYEDLCKNSHSEIACEYVKIWQANQDQTERDEKERKTSARIWAGLIVSGLTAVAIFLPLMSSDTADENHSYFRKNAPFVLYLRSFGEDASKSTLRGTSDVEALICRQTLRQSYSICGVHWCVLALDNARMSGLTAGPVRVRTRDAEWFSTFHAMARQAKLVVVDARSLTESLRIEIESLMAGSIDVPACLILTDRSKPTVETLLAAHAKGRSTNGLADWTSAGADLKVYLVTSAAIEVVSLEIGLARAISLATQRNSSST